MIKWQLEFPPKVQAEREPVLAALDRAMDEATREAVNEARRLAGTWLARHPEDFAVLDAGSDISMLDDALTFIEGEKDRAEMEEWKRHKASLAAH